MDSIKLKMSCVIGVGVLVSSPVIGTEVSTYSTIFESINSENPYEIMQKDCTVGYIKNDSQNSFLTNDLIKTDEDDYEDEFPEIELVEIPVVKRMVFRFKRPVKLEFS